MLIVRAKDLSYNEINSISCLSLILTRRTRRRPLYTRIWTTNGRKKIQGNRPRNQNTETNTETNLACLLWMDDVLLLETRPEGKQEILNITNKVAEKYHIKFGRENSQTVIIGNTKERPQFTLGQMTLDLTTTYKYLGKMINDKTNLKDQIAQLERKLEAAY